MWEHRSTVDRLDELEQLFRRAVDGALGGSPDHVSGDSGHAILHALKQMETRIMSALDDAVASLTTSVQSLADATTANDAAVQAELTALSAALAANDPTAINAAAAKISALSTAVATQAANIKVETDKLTASLPPAPPAA